MKKPKAENNLYELWSLTSQVLREAGPVKKLVVLACFLTGLASLFQLLGLGLIIPVLNGIVDPNHYEALLKAPPFNKIFAAIPFELSNKSIFAGIIVLVLLFAYLENFFLFVGQATSAKLATLVSHRLRMKVFDRYLGFGKPYFDKSSLGEQQVVLTTLITGVGQQLHFISQMFVAIFFALAFLVLMLLVSWKLTVLAFVMLPLTHISSKWLTKKLKQSAAGEIENMLLFSSKTIDVLQNIALTRLAGTEKKEVRKLEKTSDEIRRHGENTRVKRFLIPRVVDCINTTGIILLACGAVFLVFRVEAISIGRLSAFFIGLRRFTSYVQQIFVYWGNCIGGLPQVQEILDVFDDSEKWRVEGGSKEFSRIENGLKFEQVGFSYGDGKKTLSNISMEVRPGSMLAVVGPTGAGKTTLLNLIPRFLDPTEGNISIDGTELKDFDLKSLRRKIAIVSQSSLLFQDTLKNNLIYGLEDVSDEQLWSAIEDAHLVNYIKGLDKGLETLVGKDGVQLSGGERQRLSIARAVLRDPEILLLDEATSALDAETEAYIQAAVNNIISSRTVIVVAHRLATVRKAETVCVMENGKIVETGSPEELSGTGGIFQRYCELQNIVH